MRGDLLADDRRPLTEHRTLGHPAATSRGLRPDPASPTRAAADRGRPGPAPTTCAAALARHLARLRRVRPRPTSLPWLRAAPRASSRVRRTRSMPREPRRVAGRCGRLSPASSCRSSRSSSFDHLREPTRVAVAHADLDSARIPVAGDVFGDGRGHQNLLGRRRRPRPGPVRRAVSSSANTSSSSSTGSLPSERSSS